MDGRPYCDFFVYWLTEIGRQVKFLKMLWTHTNQIYNLLLLNGGEERVEINTFSEKADIPRASVKTNVISTCMTKLLE